MLTVLCFLLAGLFAGRFLRRIKRLPRITEVLLTVTIFLLLFTLGMKAGADKQITGQLQTLGWVALRISCFTIAGSIFLVWLVSRFFLKNHKS